MLRVVRSARTWFDTEAMPPVEVDHRREVLMWATLGSAVAGVISLYVGMLGGPLACFWIGGALVLAHPVCGWAGGRGREPRKLARARGRCVLEVSRDSISVTDEGSTFRVPTRDLTRFEVRRYASRFSILGFTRSGPKEGRVLLDGLEAEELDLLLHALRHEAPVPLPV